MEKTVNQRLKILREECKLSQQQFANVVELSISIISKMESGSEPSEKALKQICRILNVNATWLIEGIGESIFNKGTWNENLANAYRSKPDYKMNDALKIENPWEVEAYKQVAGERDSLREQVNKLTQALLNLSMGKANFLKALDGAGIPLYLLNNKGVHSGANVD